MVILTLLLFADEARTYSSKELPSTKWRKERRVNLHSRGGGDGPLDFSNHTTARAPPSYDQSIRYKNYPHNSSRPSVIQSVVQAAPPLPSPPLGKNMFRHSMTKPKFNNFAAQWIFIRGPSMKMSDATIIVPSQNCFVDQTS